MPQRSVNRLRLKHDTHLLSPTLDLTLPSAGQIHTSWIWCAYFVLYVLATGFQAVYFFTPESMSSMYYHILMAFEEKFLLQYLLNSFSIILNLLSLATLFGAIFSVNFLTPKFWQWLFFIRLSMDLNCRFYEMGFIKSISHLETKTAGMICLSIFLFHLPSYLVHFTYAFLAPPVPAKR